MDLIERYLGAVRWNLPARKADDILAELRDLIGARIEDREEALDRALTKSEVSALLKEFGHPLVVASGYRQHQVLIGPEVFPFYLFALRIVLLIAAAVMLVSTAAQALFSDRAIMQELAHGLNGMGWTLLGHAGLVTLIFAVIERTGWLNQYLERWKPEELPRLTVKPKSAWNSAFEIAAGIAFLLWWGGLLPISIPQSDHRLTQVPSPIWASLYWPIFALAAGHLVLSVIQWLAPHWTAIRAGLNIAVTLGTLVLLVTLYHGGRLMTLVPNGMDPGKAARLQESVDHSITIGLLVIGGSVVMQCLGELWQLARAKR